MENDVFSVGAEGPEVEAVVEKIRAAVHEKLQSGIYRDAAIAAVERHNLDTLKRSGDFFGFYIECLRQSVSVDINDFEIHERRKLLGAPLKALKKAVWKLLKFYTYRLWSQQNQINGLLESAIEGLDEKYRDKIRSLEERLSRLESEKQRHNNECGARNE